VLLDGTEMGHSLLMLVAMLAANVCGSYPSLHVHLTAVEPEVSRFANQVLGLLDMGEEAVREINGKVYAFRAEQHYHPPGHPGPNGWHKGITVYAVQAPLETIGAMERIEPGS
jgi:hypothetical protein